MRRNAILSSLVTDVAQWKFNEGGGISVADASGKGNIGTLSGDPVWGAGYLTFDGTDDYMSFPATHNLPIGSASRTFSAWANVPNTTNYFVLLEYGDSATSNARSGWYIAADAGAGVAGSQQVEVTGNTAYTTASSIDIGSWTHISMTMGATLGTAKFYKNGVLQASALTNDVTLATAQGPDCYINRINATIYGAGSIDDLRVYNRILPASEILAIFNAGAK